MASSELEQHPSRSPRRLGWVVVGWVGTAAVSVAGGVAVALWGLGLTGKLSSSIADVLDIVKLAFAFVAGVGGTLGLVLAYRRHQIAEQAAIREAAKESREDTKLFNERFERAAGQLGSEVYAVKLAGVYAMAALADDWAGGRQTCIDVLCANLRRGYPAKPDPNQTPADYQAWQDNREFRHTIIQAIVARLRTSGNSWQGLDFDFRGAVFNGGRFANVGFFGNVDFSDATFSGDTVDFHAATFGGTLALFNGVTFSADTVDFGNVTFAASIVSFSDATFSRGKVDLRATFSGTHVFFKRAAFSGAEVDFDSASVSAHLMDFSHPRDWSVPPWFWFRSDTPPPGVILPSS